MLKKIYVNMLRKIIRSLRRKLRVRSKRLENRLVRWRKMKGVIQQVEEIIGNIFMIMCLMLQQWVRILKKVLKLNKITLIINKAKYNHCLMVLKFCIKNNKIHSLPLTKYQILFKKWLTKIIQTIFKQN